MGRSQAPMNKSFEIMMQHRKGLYRYLKEIPLDKLNAIPEGFRNNIVWNIGHTIVTQQLLMYQQAERVPVIAEDMISRYRRGTVPEGEATTEEVEHLKKLLFTTVEKTTEDYQLGAFRSYKLYTTLNKVTLSNSEDALLFNNFHEGLHHGTILALRKILSC